MRVVVYKLNDGSSDELIFIVIQIQNTMFSNISNFSKFVNEARRSENQKSIPATTTMTPYADSDLT